MRELLARGLAPLEHAFPWLFTTRLAGVPLAHWAALLLLAAVSYPLGRLVAALVLRLAGRITSRTASTADDRLGEILASPLRWLLWLVLFWGLSAPLRPEGKTGETLAIWWRIGVILGSAWLVARLAVLLAAVVEERVVVGAGAGGDDLRVRGLRTQIGILRRVALAAIWIVGGAFALVQFKAARTLGVSLLASAGAAGLVVGLAAQRSIGALVAGIQISITQPIRIGDSVIIENEWGWIEEITLTYVVVRIWDLRRLVVPITKFIEAPFQNWTKVSPQLIGVVELFVDYTTPLDKLRAKLDEILAASPKWNKEVKALQVTDLSERTMKVRVLVSANDAGTTFELRCDVREQLIAYLQGLDGGRHLPRTRWEGDAPRQAAAA